MKICMLTPDINIDRRILLEAKSLVDEGNEVLVISSNDATSSLPRYEMADGVKIQRFNYDGTDWRVFFIWPYVSGALNRIYSSVKGLVCRIFGVTDALMGGSDSRKILCRLSFSGGSSGDRILVSEIALRETASGGIVSAIKVGGGKDADSNGAHVIVGEKQNWGAPDAAQGVSFRNAFEVRAEYDHAPFYLTAPGRPAQRQLEVAMTVNIADALKNPLLLEVHDGASYHCMARMDGRTHGWKTLVFSLPPGLLARVFGAAHRTMKERIAALFLTANNLFFHLSYSFVRKSLFFIQKSVSFLSGVNSYEYALYKSASFYAYDVYHAHDLPSLKPACLAARAVGARLVYDAHELYPEIVDLTPKQKKECARIEGKYIKYADKVITVNEFIAEEMAGRYGIKTPEVILNATNIPAGFKQGFKYERIREKAGIAPDKFIVLYQGWFWHTRGLDRLVSSAAFLDDGIVIALMGFGEYGKELEKIANGKGFEKKVFFLDAVSQAELLEYTASADLGIIPYQVIDINTKFCSPNKLFEFIAAGIPILANDLPFLRKIIGGYQLGKLAPLSSPESYAEAINEIYRSRERLPEIRKNVRAASRLFNWDVEAVKLLGIYNSMNAGGG